MKSQCISLMHLIELIVYFIVRSIKVFVDFWRSIYIYNDNLFFFLFSPKILSTHPGKICLAVKLELYKNSYILKIRSHSNYLTNYKNKFYIYTKWLRGQERVISQMHFSFRIDCFERKQYNCSMKCNSGVRSFRKISDFVKKMWQPTNAQVIDVFFSQMFV